MSRFANRVRVLTSTTGQGTLALGAAYSSLFLTPVEAGMVDGATYTYSIEEGSDFEEGRGPYTVSGGLLARATVLKSRISGTVGTTKMNLAGNAIVRITLAAEDLDARVTVDAVQAFSTAEREVGRGNLSAAPFDALAYNCMQINGGVSVSQELGTTGATLANTGTFKYIADGWLARYNHAAATAVLTSAQLAAASFPVALPGFSHGLQLKATTAISSPATTDYAYCSQRVEGYRIARLGWGAAGAMPLTYAFWFYSTVSGVAMIRFMNATFDRAYHDEFTVAAGWNFVSGSIAGDTSGTWVKDNGIGVYVDIFSSGRSPSPATPDAWSATPAAQTTNQTNLLGTNNNLTIIAGFTLLPGIELPPQARMPYLLRPYDQVLWDCQRFYHVWNNDGITNAHLGIGSLYAATVVNLSYKAPRQMRAAPTLAVSAASDFQVVSAGVSNAAVSAIAIDVANADVFGLSVTCATLTAGNAGLVRSVNANARARFDARL